MKLNPTKVSSFLLATLLFLLPWQARLIIHPRTLNGGIWAYGEGAIYVTEILIAVIIILTVIDRFGNKQFWQAVKTQAGLRAGRKTLGLVLALLLVTIVAGAGSFAPAVTEDYLFGAIYAICLAGVMWLSRLSTRQMVWWLWLGAAFQAVIGIFQFVTQRIVGSAWLGVPSLIPEDIGASVVEQAGDRVLRAYGLIGSPNALGIYLSVAAILGVWLVVTTKENATGKMWLGYYFGQLLIMAGLFFSFSRSSWLGLAVGLLWLLAVLLKEKGRVFITTLVRPVAAMAVLIAVLVLTFWPLVSTRFEMNTRLETKSIAERSAQVTEWQNIFYSRPGTGVGPGVYTNSLFQKDPTQISFTYQPVHNVYLLILAEWGILGAGIIFILLAIASGRITRITPWWGGVLLAWLMFGLLDHWTVTQYPGLLFTAAIFGLGWKVAYGEKVGLEVG